MISRLLTSSMRRKRHITLIFHRVMAIQDPMSPTEPTADWFSSLIDRLSQHLEIIPLQTAIERAKNKCLSGRTISITFDDGYADNFTVALPILERFNAPATFFVASSFLNGGRMWNDSITEHFRRLPVGQYESGLDSGEVFSIDDWVSRRHAVDSTIAAWKHLDPKLRQARVDELTAGGPVLPDDLMMTHQQLKAMANSPFATIGGHTRSHPILCSLDAARAKDEIEGGKADLEAIIDRPLSLFAYPNGKRGQDYRQVHADLVRDAGFTGAVATDWGNLDASTDLYAVPRFTPWHKNPLRFVADLARCHHNLI